MKLVSLIISSLLLSISLQGATSTKIGNTYFHSDGSSSTKIGGSTFHSNGSSSTKIGSSTFHSSGGSSTRIGSSTFNSNGSSYNDSQYNKIGNSVSGPTKSFGW